MDLRIKMLLVCKFLFENLLPNIMYTRLREKYFSLLNSIQLVLNMFILKGNTV